VSFIWLLCYNVATLWQQAGVTCVFYTLADIHVVPDAVKHC